MTPSVRGCTGHAARSRREPSRSPLCSRVKAKEGVTRVRVGGCVTNQTPRRQDAKGGRECRSTGDPESEGPPDGAALRARGSHARPSQRVGSMCSAARRVNDSRQESRPELWSRPRTTSSCPFFVLTDSRADFPFAEAFGCGLSARRDEPPPRQAVLHGWPRGKDARMSVAQQLAARVILELPPGGPIRG